MSRFRSECTYHVRIWRNLSSQRGVQGACRCFGELRDKHIPKVVEGESRRSWRALPKGTVRGERVDLTHQHLHSSLQHLSSSVCLYRECNCLLLVSWTHGVTQTAWLSMAQETRALSHWCSGQRLLRCLLRAAARFAPVARLAFVERCFSHRSSVVSRFWGLWSLLDAALVFCVSHLSAALRTWSDIRFHGSRKIALAAPSQVTSSHTIAELIAWSFVPVLAKLRSRWSGGMATEPGNAVVNGILLGRPRSYSGNSQEWNAFKFVFKAYVGVVAPAILIAMDRAEPLAEPITLTGLSEADRNISRNLTFLLAQVLTGPPVQIMMNVVDQNGLEVCHASHPTVQVLSGHWQAGRRTESFRRSGANVSCTNRRRDLRLNHPSSHQVADACWDESSSGAARLRENRRTYQSHVEPVQDEDSVHRVKCWRNQPNKHGDWMGQEQRQGQRQREGEKGKSKDKKDEQNTTKFEGWCDNCGKWSHKAADCWHGEEKQLHQIQSGAASATASSSSSQITVTRTDDGQRNSIRWESARRHREGLALELPMLWQSISFPGTVLTAWLLTLGPMYTCVPRVVLLTRLCNRCQSTGEDWVFDQKLARCSRLGMREVANDAQDLNGKVSTVRIPFVVCGGEKTVVVAGHARRQRFPYDCQRWLSDSMLMWNSKANCWKRIGRLDFLLVSRRLWTVM